jgi:hypothetical protein
MAAENVSGINPRRQLELNFLILAENFPVFSLKFSSGGNIIRRTILPRTHSSLGSFIAEKNIFLISMLAETKNSPPEYTSQASGFFSAGNFIAILVKEFFAEKFSTGLYLLGN